MREDTSGRGLERLGHSARGQGRPSMISLFEEQLLCRDDSPTAWAWFCEHGGKSVPLQRQGSSTTIWRGSYRAHTDLTTDLRGTE